MDQIETAIEQTIKLEKTIKSLRVGLHEKQLLIDDDPSRFKLVRSGRKFRKTSLMINWLIRKALETGLTCPYVAPNKIQAKNIAWRDHIIREINHLRELGIPYKLNEVELTMTFNNNGRIHLLGVENKEALRGISNWGAFGGDEIDDRQEDIWATIIRPNLMTYKAPAMLAGTPKGEKYMYSLEFDKLTKFKAFHYTSYDNPELDRQELEDMVQEYKQYGDDYFQQEIMAEYIKPVGMVYKEWNRENFKPIPYDVNLPVHITLDFGVNDPTALVWIQPNGSEYRVIDYYEASNANVDHFIQVMRSKPYKEPELLTGDPAGNARDIGSNLSPIELYAKAGYYIKTKDLPNPKIPIQIRTTHGIIPSLYINSDSEGCQRFKQCLLNYQYPIKKTNVVNQENEIPIHDEFSHAIKALEYYAVNIKDIGNNQEIYIPQTVGLGGATIGGYSI